MRFHIRTCFSRGSTVKLSETHKMRIQSSKVYKADHNVIAMCSYLFESFSMRTRITLFNNVLKAYIPRSPSNDKVTSSAIANASSSQLVPASDIPPPPSPSPTCRKKDKILRNNRFMNQDIRIVSFFYKMYLRQRIYQEMINKFLTHKFTKNFFFFEKLTQGSLSSIEYSSSTSSSIQKKKMLT